MIANTYVVKPFGISEVKVIALKGEPGGPTQEQVNTAVEEYMDDHPESQIPDGSVSMSKLSADVAENVSDVPNKADKVGSYPDLIAGTADNLLSSSYKTDKTPYIFRRAKGAREKGSIVGGSIVWNQLCTFTAGTGTGNGVTYTRGDDGTITVDGTATDLSYSNVGTTIHVQGHKVLLQGSPGGSSSTYYLRDGYTAAKYDIGQGLLVEAKANTVVQLVVAKGVTVNNLVFKPQIFDLTLMFGATIADYIYSVEQAIAGAGVALAKAWAGIVNDYYSYDEGSIKSVEGLVSHKMTGKNIFGGLPLAEAVRDASQNSTINTSAGFVTFNRHKGYANKVIYDKFEAGKRYTFFLTLRTQASAVNNSMRVCYTDGTITIVQADSQKKTLFYFTTDTGKSIDKFVLNYYAEGVTELYYDESGIFEGVVAQDAFEPYTVYSYPLDSSLTLRGLLKLYGDSIYYDGDIYPPSGEVERRYGVVDLGTFDYLYSADSKFRFRSRTTLPNVKEPATANEFPNAISSRFAILSYDSVSTSEDKAATIVFSTSGSHGTIWINDTDYSDAASFKAAMSGVYLVYELAEPTTEQAEPYTELQICDPDGTEEWVGASMPVGHDTKYYADLKGKIEDIPDAPSANGTYVLKATVSASGVTYSWVEG